MRSCGCLNCRENDGGTASDKSLRDEIAIAAMAAIIAKWPPRGTYTDEDEEAEQVEDDAVARGAYAYADAMLRMRDE